MVTAQNDNKHNQPLGPLMLDIAGTSLSATEREMLMHPLTGGVILFSRNFESVEQLGALTDEIHALRFPPLLISVDHEGGRVQRFREGFTQLPAMRTFGAFFDLKGVEAQLATRAAGYILASELRAAGVDLSFTPVLDLDYGESSVIGDRAFHKKGEVVAELAKALNDGLRDAGMGGVGKHFPGHGAVAADSHLAVPVDTRSYDEISRTDLYPYRKMGKKLAAVMPAHVIYENIDPHPAGFSRHWLQTVLRGELKFEGVIFSDDLSMEGASTAGGIVERAEAANEAGCDMVLVCNDTAATQKLLDHWRPALDVQTANRLIGLIPTLPQMSWERTKQQRAYKVAQSFLSNLPAG